MFQTTNQIGYIRDGGNGFGFTTAKQPNGAQEENPPKRYLWGAATTLQPGWRPHLVMGS